MVVVPNISSFQHLLMPRLIALLILAPLLFAACRQQRQLGVSVGTATYLYQADPTIFHYRDTYYLYGTNDKNADSGFLVFSSKDMLHWRRKKTNNGFALLANEHTYGDNGFWAPQVFAYRHRLYMAYTANEHIAIAGSDSPQGLFSQPEVKPLEPEVKQIDPFVFFDTDGKIYLYHVRLQNGNRIFVEKLTQNLSVKENTLTECLSAAENVQPWENTQPASWTVSEGPAVVKRGRLYYLFYSANDFRNPDYAMGYATAASPNGPVDESDRQPRHQPAIARYQRHRARRFAANGQRKAILCISHPFFKYQSWLAKNSAYRTGVCR